MNAIRLRSSFHIFIALLIRSLWSLTRGSYYVFTQARLAQLRRNRSVGKIIHLSEDSLHSWHSWHSRLSFLSTPLKTIHYLIQAQYLCSTRTQSSNNATSVVFQIWWNWKANAYSVMEGSEFRCWNVARLAHSMLRRAGGINPNTYQLPRHARARARTTFTLWLLAKVDFQPNDVTWAERLRKRRSLSHWSVFNPLPSHQSRSQRRVTDDSHVHAGHAHGAVYVD